MEAENANLRKKLEDLQKEVDVKDGTLKESIQLEINSRVGEIRDLLAKEGFVGAISIGKIHEDSLALGSSLIIPDDTPVQKALEVSLKVNSASFYNFLSTFKAHGVTDVKLREYTDLMVSRALSSAKIMFPSLQKQKRKK